MTDRYRVVVAAAPEQDDNDEAQEQGYIARVPEIAGCEVRAETRAEALAQLEEELEAQLDNMREQGVEPPRPIDEQEVDGQISLKVSKHLHRDLLFAARSADVTLEVLLGEVLSRFIAGGGRGGRGGGGRRDNRNEGGGRRGRRGGPQGQRYHNIMENRADFIEYVRQLDHEGGGGGGGGGRGGRGGGRGRR